MSEFQSLQDLSLNELVSATNGCGLHGHKGQPKAVLIRALETQETLIDPVADERKEVLSFIETHRAQLILSCHGDCNRHSWAKVLQCHKELITSQKE